MSRRDLSNRPLAAALLVALAGAGATAALGVSLIPLVVIAALPWAFVVRSRYGLSVAVPFTLLATAWTFLVMMMLGPLLGMGLPFIVGIVAGLAGLCGVLALLLAPPSREFATRPWSSVWVASILGPLIWGGGLLMSTLTAGASRLSWVMMGDSANNVLFAREIIYRGGVAVGAGENPVPLPAALLSLGMSAGRDGVDPARLLEHDIRAFVVVWALLIALTCYLAGVAAGAIVKSEHAWVRPVTGAAASVLPLTWFVTGYPLEFGFFSTHVMLPIVFAAWIAATRADRSPVLAMGANLLAATLMLATWSPLVLVPLALAVVIAVRHRTDLARLRGLRLVLALLFVIQLGVYGTAVILPGLLAQGDFLAATGGIFPFSKWLVIAAVVGALLAGVTAVMWRLTTLGWSLASVAVGGSLGLAALLFVNRNAPTLWTYYPTKYAWMLSVILLVLGAGVVIAVLSGLLRRHPGLLAAGIAAVMAASLGVTLWAPRAVPTYVWMHPIDRIVSGNFLAGGDAVAEQIFAASDPAHPTILWNSGNPDEVAINFWLLQMAADSTTRNTELRVFAYGYYDDTSTADLCSILDAMGADSRVVTSDASLRESLGDECSAIDAEIVQVDR